MSNKIAVIAYTTFSTDTRVQKEAFAALEAGYELDIFTLKDKNVSNYGLFNFVPTNIEQYKGQSKIHYILSYVRFFIFCIFNLTLRYSNKKYKFVHVHNMPNFLVFSAIVPKLFGSRIILDIHDLIPEIFSVKFRLQIDHWLIKSLYLEERFSAKFANEIIATNPYHIERFKKNKITNKNITEIVNVADEKIFYVPEKKNFNSDELSIAYPSTLAKRLGIDTLIEAVELLHNKKVKIKLNIYGDGEYRTEILEIVTKKNLENIISLSDSFISLEKLSIELDSAHVGVIPLPSNVSNDIAMPVKIFEFFAKKVCVIATDLPLLKGSFNSSVIFFKQGDSNELADKIEYLYNNRNVIEELAEKGYQKFLNQGWEYFKAKYKSILSS